MIINFKKIQLSLYKQYREGEENGFLAGFQTKTTISAAVLLLFVIVYYYLNKFGFVPSLTLPESKTIIGLAICVPPFIFVSLISLSTKELEENMHQLTDEEQKMNSLFFNALAVFLFMVLMFSVNKFGNLQ
jgi:hypothetical protein